MLSRIADSLFWLNRYMERADSLLRIIRTNYILSLDKGTYGERNWQSLVKIYAKHNDNSGFNDGGDDVQKALHTLIFDTSNVNSLKVMVTRARENARGVQDHITKEVWEQVNHLYRLINQPTFEPSLMGENVLSGIEMLARQTVLYTGLTEATMPRGDGWAFMNMGRLTERCFQTLVLSSKQFTELFHEDKETDILQWRFLLLSLSGYELHLKTYRTNKYNANVLHQVLLNDDFPRSVLYTLNRIKRYLSDIASANPQAETEHLQRLFGRLHSKVRYMDADSLNADNVQPFFKGLRNDLIDFNKNLGTHFFSYS